MRSLVPLSFVMVACIGCASVAVNDDAIETNTARTLGLQKGQFTISDRVNEGVKSTYMARTKTGQTYNCYVTGSVSVFGRVVSDAICTEVKGGKAGQQATPATPATAAPKTECNALLKAAGRCS
jgi:hypothetical protein